MNTRNFRLAALMMLTAICTSGNAQSLLENLIFEAPKQLVRPTGMATNVRTKPSKSAPKVKWPGSPWDLTVSKNEVYNAQSENAAWYNIGIGWISKSAARKVTSAPITDKMLNRFYGWSDGYDLWQEYLVSKTKSKYDLMVYYTQSDRQNRLYLGKQVGNVLVFKYSVVFTITVAEDELLTT